MHLVGQLDRHPGLDQQGLALGHDFHQRLTGLDHPAFGKHVQAHHNPGHRRAQLAVSQFKLGRRQPVTQIFGAHPGIGQLRTHFLLIFLGQLPNFQTHLQHLSLQLADTAVVFTDGPQHLGVHPFAVQQAVARDVAFAGQLTQTLQLLGQGRALQHLAGLGVTHPTQLRLGARDAFINALLIQQ